MNFLDLAAPTLPDELELGERRVIAHISMFVKQEVETLASLIDSILSVRISHQHPMRLSLPLSLSFSPSLPLSL